MKLYSLIRANKYGSPKKMILIVLLKIALIGILLHLTWSYDNLETGLGTAVAKVAIMYHVVLLMILVTVGVGLGLWIDRMIRLRSSIFHDPPKGSWTEAFMNLWGYELKEKDANQNPTIPPEPQMIEPFDLFTMPARRGRKPTFPLERWLPIAMKWENRDPMRDAFTLGELIAEHLGTNSDGSPIVSEQTYYSVWRQRAIDEIRRRAKAKKSARIQEREKEIA